ncbi:DUF6286 domain-containing protein [Glycomyces harbinensis]|uniref:DUF6286 domain-containing protein n=1 Tax=Glycomyces harbinensis TaxID=58114 RepID=A0A1G6V305_9ACTN|nr:DUF6286 domain-containing protein [Glycomyces harbinensis]SDD47863.1 hypothetical protein SAMN05216270_104174 [Glycomyces harbinensis]
MSRQIPRRLPAATWFGVVGALLLAGFAVFAGQHAAAARGWIDGPSWLLETVAALEDREPSIWVSVGGIAAALLGVWFLIAAFTPGRRTHLPVEGRCDLWVSPRAVEALAADAAERSPGVLHGRGDVQRRRLRVSALLAPGADAGVVAISEAVGERITGLADLELSVQAKEGGR